MKTALRRVAVVTALAGAITAGPGIANAGSSWAGVTVVQVDASLGSLPVQVDTDHRCAVQRGYTINCDLGHRTGLSPIQRLWLGAKQVVRRWF